MRILLSCLLLALPWLVSGQQQLDLRLDPAAGSLRLRQEIPWDGSPGLKVRLVSGLEVASAQADGGELAVVQRDGAWELAVPEGTGRLTLVVAGRPVGAGEADSPLGPERPMISPEGSFLAGGGWLAWPGPGGYRLTVTVPAGQRAVASGALQEESTGDAGYRASFQRTRPGGPPVVLAGPYTVAERLAGGGRIRSYFHPELADHSDAYLVAAAGYIRTFGERIGDYPFADFHMVSAPLPVGLGFENLTYISRRIVPLPYMRGRSLAHEILHNWWGNGVYVDYPRGNWAEGLTTYMADHALAEAEGPDAARRLRLEWLRDFAALPAQRDMPLRAFTSREHDAAHVVGYRKGAFVFHMLRRRLEEADFHAAMRHFWETHRFEVAGWEDLRVSAEAVVEQDLAAFFGQWLERAGAPALTLEAVSQTDLDGVHRLSLTLTQSEPAYRLRVPVAVETASGTEIFTADLRESRQSFQWRLQSPARRVAVDPDFQVFRRLDPLEAPPILRDVTLAARPTVVLADPDPAMQAPARALAARLLDGEPRWRRLAEADEGPLLLMGTDEALTEALPALGLSGPPAVVAGPTDARVWTERRADGAVALVVSVADRAALAALQGPLPHYGRRSYLAFEDGRAVLDGTWESDGGALRRRLAEAESANEP